MKKTYKKEIQSAKFSVIPNPTGHEYLLAALPNIEERDLWSSCWTVDSLLLRELATWLNEVADDIDGNE
jgi:hypothetical protein